VRARARARVVIDITDVLPKRLKFVPEYMASPSRREHFFSNGSENLKTYFITQ
jgi:hypothetical protein